MHGLVTDTVSNMEAMARALYNIIWAGCHNHILQLVINVCDEEKSEKMKKTLPEAQRTQDIDFKT